MPMDVLTLDAVAAAAAVATATTVQCLVSQTTHSQQLAPQLSSQLQNNSRRLIAYLPTSQITTVSDVLTVLSNNVEETYLLAA